MCGAVRPSRMTGRRYAPCPERSSYAVMIHDSWCRAFSACSADPRKFFSGRVAPSPFSPACGTRVTRSFSTRIRSRKKSTLTRWAYLEMPWRATGSSGVGTGFFSMRKYRTKRSFRVSVC